MTHASRLGPCCILLLSACTAFAAPRQTREETILQLLRRVGTLHDSAAILDELANEGEKGLAEELPGNEAPKGRVSKFENQRGLCWGTPGNVPAWAKKEIRTIREALDKASKSMETSAQGCLKGESSSIDDCHTLSNEVARLDSLEARLRGVSAEFLQPPEGVLTLFQTTQLLKARSEPCQKLAEKIKATLASLPVAHAPHIVREWRERDKRLRAAFLFRATSTDTLATVSTALGSVTSQPLGHAERLGGTDLLSVSLGAGIGEAQSLSGTRLLISMPNLLSDLGDHVGRLLGGHGTDPQRLLAEEDGGQRVERSAQFGLRFEVPLTRTAIAEPFSDAEQQIAYQYGFWFLWNMGDKTDPRHGDRKRCYDTADALTPAFDVESRALHQLERRRHALYSYCARQALPDWRVGVRGGVTLQAIPKLLTPVPEPSKEPLPDLRLGMASLGVITEFAPWMTLQVMARRGLHEPLVAEGSAALHTGGGIGGKWYGVESVLHAGVDVSTTWRNDLGKAGPYEFSALVAPSLAAKIGQLAAVGVSGGYVFGGPRSGWTANAALVWDMDFFFLQEPAPLSSEF